MSQALRKLTASVQKNQAIIIFINQLRMKIGALFGNPETTSGGNALKFYASIRLDIRRGSNIKNNDGQYIGHLIKIKVVKNKVAIPHKSAEFELIYENPQISALRDLLNLACDLSIVQCDRGWYSINDTKLGHGKEKAIDFLKTQENLVLDIKNKILNVIKSEDRLNIAVK
jgi:recombination protein RecA